MWSWNSIGLHPCTHTEKIKNDRPFATVFFHVANSPLIKATAVGGQSRDHVVPLDIRSSTVSERAYKALGTEACAASLTSAAKLVGNIVRKAGGRSGLMVYQHKKKTPLQDLMNTPSIIDPRECATLRPNFPGLWVRKSTHSQEAAAIGPDPRASLEFGVYKTPSRATIKLHLIT